MPTHAAVDSAPWSSRQLIDVLGATACRFDVVDLTVCDSTNAELMRRIEARPELPSGTVIVAERQTAGRGRRGRDWQSSQQRPEHSLTFSLLWRFPRASDLSGLSLAVGVAVAEAISELAPGQSFAKLRLKWPNDILLALSDGLAKAGGILIELQATKTAMNAVIGIGLNLHTPEATITDQRVAGLDAALGEVRARENVLAEVLRHLAPVLDVFALQGFSPLQARWQEKNAFAGRQVRLLDEQGEVASGECLGVDADGALRVGTLNGPLRWLVGDVSLRHAE